jgi:hypothetical protein
MDENTFWKEYWSLPYVKRMDGRRLVRCEAGLRGFNPLIPNDWRKRAVYRRWLKRWGLSRRWRLR